MLPNPRRFEDKHRPKTTTLSQVYSLRCLVTFVSHRLLRGGPRRLLHVGLFCLALVVLTGVLPQRLSEVVLGATCTTIWRWDSTPQPDKGGGLRIVLFGEHDIATPERNGIDGSTGPSWTEVLCQELGCSSHLSFVPTRDPPRLSFTSNSLYAALLEPILNDTIESDGAGIDYTFLADEYPVRWDAPDLKNQVDRFLSLARPRQPPAETLWVFSFGMWDIWSLAAFPRNDAHDNIDGLAMEVFNHVDRLYEASLDTNSVAYSGNAEAPAEFRILIPQLFDPSLLPAWQMDRPGTPMPHSIAEQTRNAARLTEKWNHGIRNEMETWVNTKDSEQEGDATGFPPGVTILAPDTPSRKKRSDEPTDPSLSGTAGRGTRFPQRDALAYDLPAYLLDVIVDRQLREAGIVDSLGDGAMPPRLGFQDVSVPCVHDSDLFGRNSSVTHEGRDQRVDERGPTHVANSARVLCDNPDRFLFHTSFTLGTRAIREIGRQAAYAVRRNDSIRAFWEGIGEPAPLKRRGPGSWAEDGSYV